MAKEEGMLWALASCFLTIALSMDSMYRKLIIDVFYKQIWTSVWRMLINTVPPFQGKPERLGSQAMAKCLAAQGPPFYLTQRWTLGEKCKWNGIFSTLLMALNIVIKGPKH